VSDKRAIGVFDSGLGGLTVVRELFKTLPNEEIIYLEEGKVNSVS
jgi:glutamate racemase